MIARPLCTSTGISLKVEGLPMELRGRGTIILYHHAPGLPRRGQGKDRGVPSLADISTASSQRKSRCASAVRVRTSVRSGLLLDGRPRAVCAGGRRAEALKEVEVGCRGVRNLADDGIQRRPAVPILHELPPPGSSTTSRHPFADRNAALFATISCKRSAGETGDPPAPRRPSDPLAHHR